MEQNETAGEEEGAAAEAAEDNEAVLSKRVLKRAAELGAWVQARRSG